MAVTDRRSRAGTDPWGTNGNGGLVRSPALSAGLVQGSPSASWLLDDNDGLPTRLENWHNLGLQLNAATLPSLGMLMDPNRGTFRYDWAKDDVLLDFPVDGNLEAETAMRRVHDKLAEANGVGTGSTAMENPTLTIVALAERNVSRIIAEGR